MMHTAHSFHIYPSMHCTGVSAPRGMPHPEGEVPGHRGWWGSRGWVGTGLVGVLVVMCVGGTGSDRVTGGGGPGSGGGPAGG